MNGSGGSLRTPRGLSAGSQHPNRDHSVTSSWQGSHKIRGVLRKLAAVGVVFLLGGCGYAVNAGKPVVVCGTTLWTGAMTPAIPAVQRPGPSPAIGMPPAGDQLPMAGTEPGHANEAYVRVSDSCDHGAVVTVTPADAARLRIAARAKDHHLVVLVLDTSAPVTVQAWRDGVFAGSLRTPS